MKMKQIIIGVFLVILLMLSFFAYQGFTTKKYLNESKAFSTKETCEQTTGKECDYSVCDYIPAGKTIEEVCGARPGKGFYPIQDNTSALGITFEANCSLSSLNPSLIEKLFSYRLACLKVPAIFLQVFLYRILPFVVVLMLLTLVRKKWFRFKK